MMTTTVDKDHENHTMTITAVFEAPIERVWQLWSDPRRLERWWGPPTYPATVTGHELAPGGTVTYYMTGPEGDRYHGLWRVLSVDAPHGFEFEDAFADGDGTPNPEMPVTVVKVALEAAGGGTRMSVHSTFPSVEAMQQLVEMGMEEGMLAAMSQIEDLLAEMAA